MDNNLFESSGYKRTRGAYVLQAMFEYFISILVTDAFIAKILDYLGVSEANIGIITTIISLAMAFQLGSLLLSKLRMNAKTISLLFSTVSQLLFALLYLVPFFTISDAAKRTLAVAFIVIAYFALYIFAPIHYRWAYKFVPWEHRARFSATKEMVSLAAGSAFSIIVGIIIDRYEGLGNLEGAFLFIASAAFIVSLCNFICILLMKEEPREEEKKEKADFKAVMKNTFGNKGFRLCLYALSLWEFTRYFQLGFMGSFKNTLVGGSGVFDNPMVAVQIINLAGHGVRLLLSYPIAKYSDRKGYAKGFQIGLIIAACAFLCNIFTSTSTWYLIIVYTILHYACYVGITSNGYNILYSYVDNAYFAQALAIKNCIAGLCGFGAAMIASRLLTYVQANGNTFMGIPVFGQQVISAVSFVLTVIVFIFVKFVVAKQKQQEPKY